MIKTYLKEKGNEDGKKRNGVEMEINWWCGKDQHDFGCGLIILGTANLEAIDCLRLQHI